jgi:hypothetical protein
MSDRGAATRDTEQKLTAEAEKAIRSYLWKVVGPTSVVFVLVAAVLGFFVRDIAMQQACNKALTEVYADVHKMALAVAAAKAKSDIASDIIETQLKKVEQITKRANDLDDVVSRHENMVNAAIRSLGEKDQVRKIADALVANPEVIKEFQEAAKGLDKEVLRLRQDLTNLLQIDCMEGTLPMFENKPEKFEFKFPVKHAWIEFVGPQAELVTTTMKGNAVTLRLKGTSSLTEDSPLEARCRVCAAAF